MRNKVGVSLPKVRVLPVGVSLPKVRVLPVGVSLPKVRSLTSRCFATESANLKLGDSLPISANDMFR